MSNARTKKKKQQQAQASRWEQDPSSRMHVVCARCGFRIESARALETGWSLSEVTGLKYRFCPNCGRRMQASVTAD